MDWMISALKGLDGHISSKRLVTLIAFACIVIAFMVNVFMSIPLEQHFFDGNDVLGYGWYGLFII